MPIAFLLLCGLIAAPVPADEAATVKDVLERALEQCWEQDDPRASVRSVLLAMFRLDPPYAVQRTRTASRRLAGLMHLAPTVECTYAWLAVAVAEHDRDLRDELLARSIEESSAALADDSFWSAKRAHIPRFTVDPQTELDRKKLHRQFAVRLQQAVLARNDDEAAAEEAMKKLFADARAAGGYFGCIETRYEDVVVAHFADLDWRWMMNFVAAEWGDAKFAKYCDDRACSAWDNHDRGEFTRQRVLFAVEHGVRRRHTFEVLLHYDIALAWMLASQLEKGVRDRDEIKHLVHRELVWHDLDAALTAAEAETDAYSRREMLSQVARAWAHHRPESIERAIRNQDTELRRDWARADAADELLRRSNGDPPPTRAQLSGEDYSGASAQHEFRRRQPRSSNPQEVRILENPRDTAWLTEKHRQVYLNQAGVVAYWETGDRAGIEEIVAGLSDQQERDQVRRYNAQHLAELGELEHAVALWQQIESQKLFAFSACQIADAVIRRAQNDE